MSMKAKRFKKVYIEITNVCNLACSFCPKSARGQAFMDPERFACVLDQIKPYTDYIYLHVKGEPLLHPDIGRLLDISHEKGFWVNITANGTLIGRVGEKLISKPALRQINFSLHSILDKNAGAHTGLSPEEYLDRILTFIRDARDRSGMISSLRLWNLGGGGPESGSLSDSSNRQLLGLIEKEFQLPYRIDEIPLPTRGIKLAEKVYLNQDYEFQWPDIRLEEQNENGFCYGLKDQAAVLVDGTVVPCCLDGEGIIDLGNVFQTDFSEIINSERALNILKGFECRRAVEELCKRCGYRTRFGK